MRWSTMIVPLVLVAAGGCAQETDDDVLEPDPRGTVTTDDTGTSGSGSTGSATPSSRRS